MDGGDVDRSADLSAYRGIIGSIVFVRLCAYAQLDHAAAARSVEPGAAAAADRRRRRRGAVVVLFECAPVSIFDIARNRTFPVVHAGGGDARARLAIRGLFGELALF